MQATISWKRHKDNPKNTVSSVGSASVCLSVTLICIRNQMKEWKAAYRSQKHVTLSQPLLSVCGLLHMVMPLPGLFAGKAGNTSCGAVVKLVTVSRLQYTAFHINSDSVRWNLIDKFSSQLRKNTRVLLQAQQA